MTFKSINIIKPNLVLGQIVGSEPEPYPAKLKKLWNYMRENKLIEKVPNPAYVPKAQA